MLFHVILFTKASAAEALARLLLAVHRGEVLVGVRFLLEALAAARLGAGKRAAVAVHHGHVSLQPIVKRKGRLALGALERACLFVQRADVLVSTVSYMA